jgi:hypothetical protein
VQAERLPLGPAWDAWLAGTDAEGHYFQTSAWTEIDLAANGRSSHVLRAGPDVAGVFSHLQTGGGEVTCLCGPVISGAFEADALRAILREAEALAAEAECTAVRVVGRPPRSVAPIESVIAPFDAAGYEMTSWLTAVVNLRRADDALLAGFDRAVRKAIRRCTDAGVTVRRCDDLESFERDFLEPFAAVKKGYDPRRDRIAYDLDRSDAQSYHVAVDKQGNVLATLGTYRFAGVATEVMSARTERGREIGLPAQDLLHWEVMRRHRELGDAWFDLAGFAPAPMTEKEAGIRRYKEKWRGIPVASPTFAKPTIGRLRLARRRFRRDIA